MTKKLRYDLALHAAAVMTLRNNHIKLGDFNDNNIQNNEQTQRQTTNYTTPVELHMKENSEIHKPFSREELDELWQHTDDLDARVALILCYTGLRPTEPALIKTADVDFSDF